jgi:hypothetical protein
MSVPYVNGDCNIFFKICKKNYTQAGEECWGAQEGSQGFPDSRIVGILF